MKYKEANAMAEAMRATEAYYSVSVKHRGGTDGQFEIIKKDNKWDVHTKMLDRSVSNQNYEIHSIFTPDTTQETAAKSKKSAAKQDRKTQSRKACNQELEQE